MSGRKITYDEIVWEIHALPDLTPEERHELLLWIRDFKREMTDSAIKSLPPHFQKKVQINVR